MPAGKQRAIVAVLAILGGASFLSTMREHAPRRDPPALTTTENSVPTAALLSGEIRFHAEELPFQYDRGDTSLCLPVEPVGGGVALLDYDGDGDLDIFFPQGGPLHGERSGAAATDVLLENDRGVFRDVSAKAGLTPQAYGVGVTVSDYDGDGDPDIYVTRYGKNTLWRNEGGRFVDATDEAGVGCSLWSLGAAFADFDNDGDLDLFVGNYLDFNPADAPFRRDPETGVPEYALPEDFPGLSDVIYRNDGGRLVDVSAEAKINRKTWGMGVLAADFDRDGLVDILVANDTKPNLLWRNLGGWGFQEVGIESGIAVNAAGIAEANMGIAYGDVNGDLEEDVLISHFLDEHDTLWLADRDSSKRLFFRDATRSAGLSNDSRGMTGWGTVFADFDHDGDLDLFVANGHIREWPRARFTYENPPLLWSNDGKGRFKNVSAVAGEYFTALHQARGVAAGDLDGDGDLDLVVVHYHKPSVVLWNDSARLGGWLSVRLIGRGQNRDAIGATVTIQAGDKTIVRSVVGGGSYLSSSDSAQHFGLGETGVVDALTVKWPNGEITRREKVPVRTRLVLKQEQIELAGPTRVEEPVPHGSVVKPVKLEGK